MARPRELDKRRKAIRNIRKITRTMELIATARFKRAMDRAVAARAYTSHMTEIVRSLVQAGLQVRHPLLEQREPVKTLRLLVITANRGLCGGYNANLIRTAIAQLEELRKDVPDVRVEVSGKRGISGLRFRHVPIDQSYTHFDDRPRFDQVEVLANRYLEEFILGKLDSLVVVYMRFLSASRQEPAADVLLPVTQLTAGGAEREAKGKAKGEAQRRGEVPFEFLPSAASILEEIVPATFKTRLFKCFLDAAVSEQIARMVAMKTATENADEMIRKLTLTYNRARQTHITKEIMEVIGGAEALRQ